MAYRDTLGHTVAPPGLHREGTVANRSLTGTDCDHFLPQTGSGPKHCRECLMALQFLHDSVRPCPPATSCWDAPGRTPGQCDPGFTYMTWKSFLIEICYMVLLANLSTKCSVSFCDRSMSGVRACVHASVNNFFKQHLLWNRLLDFDQTSQQWSLGGPLSKLFKPFQLVA